MNTRGRSSTPTQRIATGLKRRSLTRLHPSAVASAKVANLSTSSAQRGRAALETPLPNRFQTGRSTTCAGQVSRAAPIGNRPIRPQSTIPVGNGVRSRPGSLGIVNRKSEVEALRQELDMLKLKCAAQDEAYKTVSEMNTTLREKYDLLSSKYETQSQRLELVSGKLEESESMLSFKTEEANSFCNQLKEKERLLRKMHNDVVDLRGQIRVTIRVRPPLPSENDCTFISYPSRNCISLESGPKPVKAEFETVFTPVFTQEDVFEHVKELILSCLHGYNVGLIAFGQTGSGKTYTMRGGLDAHEGVIPRAVRYLLEESEKLGDIGWDFSFSVSFVEIYNNEAYDLLNDHQKLKLRLSGNDVAIDGLVEHPIKRASEVERLLNVADSNRKTAATKCNAKSSRSHAIFQWNVKAYQKETNVSTTSTLKLVDLAGSERAKDSGVSGDQFKEMTFINQSLSTLQKCINMQRNKAAHVPYREAKLTQLLKDCLGAGSSKTMVIVNVNPCDEQVAESKRSVEFASKMRDTKIGTAIHQRDV